MEGKGAEGKKMEEVEEEEREVCGLGRGGTRRKGKERGIMGEVKKDEKGMKRGGGEGGKRKGRGKGRKRRRKGEGKEEEMRGREKKKEG